MNAVSVDIKDILVAGGVGTFGTNSGWSIFISEEPKNPDTSITIYDTGGVTEYYLDRNLHPLQHANFQVRVRSAKNSYTSSYSKALAIQQLLDKKSTYIESSGDHVVKYYLIQNIGSIFCLGKDDNDRHIWTMNFQTTRHEAD